MSSRHTPDSVREFLADNYDDWSAINDLAQQILLGFSDDDDDDKRDEVCACMDAILSDPYSQPFDIVHDIFEDEDLTRRVFKVDGDAACMTKLLVTHSMDSDQLLEVLLQYLTRFEYKDIHVESLVALERGCSPRAMLRYSSTYATESRLAYVNVVGLAIAENVGALVTDLITGRGIEPATFVASDGSTALHFALREGKQDMVALIARLLVPAEFDKRNPAGDSPLHDWARFAEADVLLRANLQVVTVDGRYVDTLSGAGRTAAQHLADRYNSSAPRQRWARAMYLRAILKLVAVGAAVDVLPPLKRFGDPGEGAALEAIDAHRHAPKPAK